MKILYWAEAFPPSIGGLEVLSGEFVKAMQKRGHELVVVCSDIDPALPKESRYEGIQVIRYSMFNALQSRDFSKLKAISNEISKLKLTFRPDLLHFNYCGPTGFFHLRTRTERPIPTVLALHAPVRNADHDPKYLRQLMDSAGWVTAVSAALMQEMRQLMPEFQTPFSVIYNGLPLPDIEPIPLSFDPPQILCLGRIVHDKGFDLAIAAFASLIESFPQARLVIAGDGPERSVLQQQAARLGLTDWVEFLGWVNPEKAPSLINRSTIVLMPSRWREPFGLVAIQAAQLGRPVIATRDGGLPEVVLDQKTGLIIEKDDVKGLVEAIAFLLNHPASAIEMGSVGRKRSQELFAFEPFVDKYEDLYSELIASNVNES